MSFGQRSRFFSSIAILVFASACSACGAPSKPTAPGATEVTAHVDADAGMAGNDAIALPTPVPSAAPSAAPSVAPSPSASAHAAESPDAETKETADTKVASAVREKGGHKKCLMSVLDGHPGWKPKYELVVHLLADGHVKKVVVDKKKSDTSVPEFFTCLVKQLEGETFPAPGREVSARLSYHAH